MKIINSYTPFIEKVEKNKGKNLFEIFKDDPEYSIYFKSGADWGIDFENVNRWVRSKEYVQHRKVAENFIKIADSVIEKVESAFNHNLKGEVRLSPSMMLFDGFARYENGSHTVLFGVDHPDADENYLKVLMAHELSHVYRDHQPDVWGFLGKPLKEVSRQEYLDNMSAEEHLVSEGLATLFSQVVFPEVPLHVHHYYLEQEMLWCFQHKDMIEQAILKEMEGEQNVWKFYEDDVVKPGSPSRVQYFWAAQRLQEWLNRDSQIKEKVIKAHSMSAKEFKCFDPK